MTDMSKMTQTPVPSASVTIESLKQSILRYSRYSLGKEWESLTARERFIAASLAVREQVIEVMLRTERTTNREGKKRIYYLSMEFLAGRALSNNLLNLGIHDQCTQALEELGVDIDELIEMEPDPALGNGGLGRLAACFVDSMATLGLAGYGYGINYEFGLFRQVFREGRQTELPDVWRNPGTPLLIQRPDMARTVNIYGRLEPTSCNGGPRRSRWVDTMKVIGVPSDLPVVGYGGKTVNYLRLYAAKASSEFDIEIFNNGDYVKALERKIHSERISKVLYPSDDIPAGRELRLLQEYFFVACSLQDIIDLHGETEADLLALDKAVAIQQNDTHPALAVAELMRILVDERNIPWDTALGIVRRTLAYTNHTLLPEAQETWPVDLLNTVLPRHMEIILELNEGFLKEVEAKWPGDKQRKKNLSIIDTNGGRHVRMMHLSIVGSHAVNGVSTLHSELLKSQLVPGFNELWPEKFQSKTNGVTQRRWLLKANPRLAKLLTAKLGDHWITDLYALKGLEVHLDDQDLLQELRDVRYQNKIDLSKVIRRITGLSVDPSSMFDVHVKRIHEYKRQLLNVMRIVHDYLNLVEDGTTPPSPRTYLFGGKAAPGYVFAKLIIRFINAVASVVNKDRRANEWMKVAFLPDYRVTLAEQIIPAADLSEQISTAGMEASGTGNMKFMMNGALTVGTLDGANIEMIEEAGEENLFIFGLTSQQVDELRASGKYDPRALVDQDPRLARIISELQGDRFCPQEPGLFRGIADSLLGGDHYFILKDLIPFLEIQQRVSEEYQDKDTWTRKSLLNIARSGKFSSDRTIREYARDIWGIK